MPKVEDAVDPIAEEARTEYEAEKAAEQAELDGEPQKKDETSEEETHENEEESQEEKDETSEESEDEESEDEEGKEKKDKEDKEETLSDEELVEASDDDLSEDQRVLKQELITSQEDEFLAREEKDLNKDEKVQRTEIVQKREDATKATADAYVKAYAEKKEISEDDARKSIESADNLLDGTFHNDARELARTHQHLQRAYERNSKELKNLRDAPPKQAATIENVIKGIDKGQIKVDGKPASREEVIAVYRDLNPELSEMEDDVVLKLAAKDIVSQIGAADKSDQVQFSADAKEKKAQLINTLKDIDDKYAPSVKAIVDKMSDYQIMKTEGLDDTILWARGKYDKEHGKLNLDKAVKEAEDRGFKRGQASRKIKTPPPGKPPASKTTPNLSESQKEDAWDMFPQSADDKEAFESYKEVQASRKKPKK